MQNQLFGIITIICCCIGYFYSWRFQKELQYKAALLLLIGCGFALRFYTACDFFLHDWDERYHALVAKNLMTHPLKPMLYAQPLLPYDYINWTANHVWLHKQPLPLWTMAGSMKIFGVGELAVRLPSVLLTTIGILLTFQIGSYLFNKKVGFLAAFFYSINGLIIELTAGRVATDHTDTFFLFFVELAVYLSICFVQKKNAVYNLLAGVAIGAAILCKWLPALIVLPVWWLIVWDSKKFPIRTIITSFLLLCGAATLVFLPWQLYIFSAFSLEANWEASFNFRHITEALEGQGGHFYYFLEKIIINYNDLIFLPLLWYIWRLIKKKELKRFAVFIWFAVPFLFFSVAKTKMQAYLVFTAPALFLITADFWHMLSAWRTTQKLQWLSTLVLFLMIALPVRYSIERIKPFENRERNPEWVREMKQLNALEIKRGVLFNYYRYIEAMFYTDLVVYPFLPDQATIRALQARGYEVFLNDADGLCASLKTMEGVKVVMLKDEP